MRVPLAYPINLPLLEILAGEGEAGAKGGVPVLPRMAMPNMPMPHNEQLEKIHTPVLYMLGGPTDIAYNNGMDDYARINHVPAFAANFPVGHGGTYARFPFQYETSYFQSIRIFFSLLFVCSHANAYLCANHWLKP